MSRPYSERFLKELYSKESDSLGIELAKLVIDSNLSATHVAEALGVTRTTVYQWFRGQGVREMRRKEISALISLLKQDLESGLLPVSDNFGSKEYMDSLISGS